MVESILNRVVFDKHQLNCPTFLQKTVLKHSWAQSNANWILTVLESVYIYFMTAQNSKHKQDLVKLQGLHKHFGNNNNICMKRICVLIEADDVTRKYEVHC